MLVRDIVIDLDIKKIRGRARDCGVNDVIGEATVGWWQECKDLAHYRARREIRVVGQDVAGDRRVRSGIVKLCGGE